MGLARHPRPGSGGDVSSLADLSKACGLLNYAPIVDFRQGLEVTMAWYKSAWKR